MNPISSPPSTHALDIPEIVFGIARFLDATDVLACSSVSRSFYFSFAPFVWQDLHFGQQYTLNRDIAPFARHIHIHQDTEWLPQQQQLPPLSQCRCPHQHHKHQHHQRDSEATPSSQFLSTLQKIPVWIKSLSIHSHESMLPMQLGKHCRQLESFTIHGHSLLRNTEYWETCRTLIIQNQGHLRSLSMINWMSQYRGSPDIPQIVWNPISECAQAFNLRALTLMNSCIGLKDLPAFWKICERLEELVLDSANFDISMIPSVVAARKMEEHYEPQPTIRPLPSADVASEAVGHVLFPRLRSLRLCGMNWVNPRHQLQLLIQPCPVLQTLYWHIDKRKFCPNGEFVELFLASTWPDLNSITITNHRCPIFSCDQLHQIVQASTAAITSDNKVSRLQQQQQEQQQEQQQQQQQHRRPLRCLDIKTILGILPATFELLRYHFETIQKIDLTYCEGDTSNWSMQVLTSCPSLEVFKAKRIKAQDILQAQKQQYQLHPDQQYMWACRKLQALTIFIDMEFKDNGPNRRFTVQELEQCRSIFRLLAGLKELRTLDMLTTYSNACDPCHLSYHRDPHHPRHLLVPLPLRLKAGLDLLSTSTRLEKVWFWGGRQYLPKQELEWMVLHWRRLKNLAGGGRIKLGSPKSLDDKYIWGKPLQAWLTELGICTLGTRYELYADNMACPETFEDCCGASDDEEKEGKVKTC